MFLTDRVTLKEADSEECFFHSLRPFLNDTSLLVGDFNTVLSPADLSVRNVFKNDVGMQELFSSMSDYNIIDIDVWRMLHQGKKDFSRRQLVKGFIVDLPLRVNLVGRVTRRS
uniref:Endonuclease/exonuclease/phosphatase domain-containing protein n=1 Tax=Oryzias latipes TaxID=8090 RepID=A0A3P9HRL6_ORYLA